MYVPILTGKTGEIVALSKLRLQDQTRLTPLIDVPPVPRPRPPREGESPEEPPDPSAVLRRLLSDLSVARGIHDTMLDLDGFDRYRFGVQHPIEFAMAKMINPPPILVSSNRSSEAYLAAAADAQVMGRAIRLHVEPDSTPLTLTRQATRLVEALATNPHAADLILDIGHLGHNPLSLDVEEVFRRLKPEKWRSVTLAGTSLPQRLDGGEFRRIRRAEWIQWQAIHQGQFGGHVGFGDYGITGPRRDDDEPPYPGAPHLRYLAHDFAFLIWKGRRVDPGEGGAVTQGQTYPDLCRALMARSAYGRRRSFAGSNFSWGDRMIWETAEGIRGRGRPTDWVRYATNHHLAMVCRHLGAYALPMAA